jgi:hypothetical protein
MLVMQRRVKNKTGKAAGNVAYPEDTQVTENAAWRSFLAAGAQ